MTAIGTSDVALAAVNAPIFSIILPVYNTRDLVEAAIRSVLDQSETDIEVIVIDDGSTDDSATICDRLRQEDTRLRLFRKSNEGQGVARNLGLTHAVGRYILFLDSDDVMLPGLLARVRTEFEETAADVVCFGLAFHDLQDRPVATRAVRHRLVQEGAAIFEDAMLDRNFMTAPWSKAYRRELLEAHGIRFPALRAYEDALFGRHVAFHAARAVYIEDILYHALTRAGSTSRALSTRNFGTAAELIAEERRLFEHLIGPSYDDALFGAHVVRFFAHLLILAAFRIPAREQRQACLTIADSCGFSQYAKRPDVRRLLSWRTRLQVVIAQRPAIGRFAAHQAQRFGITPY